MSAYSYEDLLRLLDCKQAASLKRVLKSRGIRWSLDRRGKPWTTEAQLNQAVSPARTFIYTRPPCQKQKKKDRSPRGSARSTAPGTGSSGTNGPSYVA